MPAIYTNSLILNVDDNDGARYARTRVLTQAGFTVIEAATGGEALERATRETPDLVLLDIKLPDIDGLEVCRRLKEGVLTQSILVLQISAALTGSADKIRALEGGADNYLCEPIEPGVLVANIDALLRLGRVERELREADRRKDIFLATLAHELRNPLAPIRNTVEMLQWSYPDVSPKEAKARQIILRQTVHLVQLVDDLLDVARIAKGTIMLREQPVELKAFIEAAIETATPILEERKHNLTLDLPQVPLWINGDPVRLAQVIGNILHNAAKFTPKGGRIRVSAERANEGVKISVIDNGIGIAADSVVPIFNMFFQAGHVNDRVQDGLGIGLSLIKNLVELHHGSVAASSPGSGLGSTFEVWLPLLDEGREALNSTAQAPVQNKVNSRRVLVVDDNPDAAYLIGALLESDGHTTQIRFNGIDAITCADVFKPEVVILDIGLSDMTGYDVALRMRQITGLESVTLVALTGYGQDKEQHLATAAGFDRHMVKPITLQNIGDLMQ